jgi:hypothetical protein
MNNARKACLVLISTGVILVVAAFVALALSRHPSPSSVSAHPEVASVPASGVATIDGTAGPVEPINAALQNYPLIPPGSGDPFTTTLNIMNTGYTLYMDIKTSDDEYYNNGNYVPGLEPFPIGSGNERIVFSAVVTLTLSLKPAPRPVPAYTGEAFGPACGAAAIDGVIDPAEWVNASVQTFQMVPPGSGDPFTATLYVMNSGYYLYMGITINDDEFSTYGDYLPQGDTFRIDFDNDHSGSLFTQNDDVLLISAGSPKFQDNYIVGTPISSSNQGDAHGGGTLDGAGAASRVGELNHFELRHPLCSGDSHDICLHPADIVGFRLEYLDAQADGSYGGVQFFPSRFDTSIEDIVVGTCSAADIFNFFPLISK